MLLEAVARAGKVSAGDLRRAVMMAGEWRRWRGPLLIEGEAGPPRFRVQIFRRATDAGRGGIGSSTRRSPISATISRSQGSSTARAFRCTSRATR